MSCFIQPFYSNGLIIGIASELTCELGMLCSPAFFCRENAAHSNMENI